MKRIWCLVVTITLLVVPAGAAPTVVSSQQFSGLMAASPVQILDSRSREAYQAGHIAGALSVDTKTFYEDSTQAELHFPPFSVIAEKLGRLGVRSGVPTLVYGDQLQLNREAGMLFVYLYLLGTEEVSFLDGGIQKWVKDGYPVSVVVATATATPFVAHLRTSMIVSKEVLKESLGKPGLVLLDTRSPKEYSGELPGNHIGTAGHIPTALSIEFSQALQPDGTFKPAEVLQKIYGRALAAQRTILYCRTGPRTTPTGLVLVALLGLRNIEFYTGSMIEWSNTPGYPVVLGGEPLP